jgi:hypothetical protein
VRIIRGLAAIAGVGILAAVAHVTITATGGYGWNTNAPLTMALAVGVAMGAPIAGLCFEEGRWPLALSILLALIAGELYGFGATANRHVANLEAQAAPIHDAEARHKAAVARLAAAQNSDVVERAEAAKAKSESEGLATSAGKSCKEVCKGAILEAARNAEAAVVAARAQMQTEIDAAGAALERSPLPGSASPLADRLGLQPWILDLAFAGLRSFACTVLAGALLAFAAHGRRARPVYTTAPVARVIEPLARISKPRLVSSSPPALSVIDFGADQLEAAPGDTLDFDEFFDAYDHAAQISKLRALTTDEFIEPFKKLCAEAGIRTRKRGSKLLLVDVKLAS